jgi:hypothetical protein
MFQLLICKQGFTVLKRLWHLLPRLQSAQTKRPQADESEKESGHSQRLSGLAGTAKFFISCCLL